MIKKIKKVLPLLTKKDKIKNSLRQILYEESVSAILKKNGLKSLPEISGTDLFALFPQYDQNKEINLKSDFATGSSPINDYFFLCQIANALRIENYFEIGTWVGLSASNIANNISTNANVYTLDIPYDHPELKIFEIPEYIFGYHSKKMHNVHHLKGDSKTFDYSAFTGKMELIFVDGNHSMDYVINDTQKALTLLKNDKSIIVWHDYLSAGEVNPYVLCGILKGLPVELHKHLFHLKQSNTALYSKSFNFKQTPTAKWEIPEKVFDIRIKPLVDKNPQYE